VRVVFLRLLSLPVELAGVFQVRQAMAWQRVARASEVRPWFLRDAPGFELLPELAPRASEAIFDKITFSAFESTPLDIALRDCAITAFAICGLALEIGIEPTVRHGADLGYIPIVVTDACGAGNDEAGKRRSRASSSWAMPTEPTQPRLRASSQSERLRNRRHRWTGLLAALTGNNHPRQGPADPRAAQLRRLPLDAPKLAGVHSHDGRRTRP
jgi:hypothetical protein